MQNVYLNKNWKLKSLKVLQWPLRLSTYLNYRCTRISQLQYLCYCFIGYCTGFQTSFQTCNFCCLDWKYNCLGIMLYVSLVCEIFISKWSILNSYNNYYTEPSHSELGWACNIVTIISIEILKSISFFVRSSFYK